jgi:site-specific DNA recombinase
VPLEQQRAAVDADITRTEQAIKRYQLAFEAGTMAAEDCGPRLQELAAQLRDLRARACELDDELSGQPVLRVSDELFGEVRARIERIMEYGSPAEKKTLLKECIDELRIEGNRVYPRYRLPMAGVRIVGTLVGRGGLEPPTSR